MSEAMSSPAAAVKAVSPRPTAITGRSWTIMGTLVAILGVFYYFNAASYTADWSDAAFNAIYIWGILFSPVAAAVIFWAAGTMEKGSAIRTQWTVMGWSVVVYAIGDFIWTYLDLFAGLDPYPSVADVFYTLEYAFFLAVMFLAVRSYRGVVKLTGPVLGGGVVGLGVGALIYATVLGPYILPAGPDELTAMGKFVSVLYPVGDTFFMLAPAVALALVVSRMGAGRFSWAWWVVVVGALVFAATDTVYSYIDWAGAEYLPILDVGWVAANLLFAFGALIARDVNRA